MHCRCIVLCLLCSCQSLLAVVTLSTECTASSSACLEADTAALLQGVLGLDMSREREQHDPTKEDEDHDDHKDDDDDHKDENHKDDDDDHKDHGDHKDDEDHKGGEDNDDNGSTPPADNGCVDMMGMPCSSDGGQGGSDSDEKDGNGSVMTFDCTQGQCQQCILCFAHVEASVDHIIDYVQKARKEDPESDCESSFQDYAKHNPEAEKYLGHCIDKSGGCFNKFACENAELKAVCPDYTDFHCRAYETCVGKGYTLEQYHQCVERLEQQDEKALASNRGNNWMQTSALKHRAHSTRTAISARSKSSSDTSLEESLAGKCA